MAIRAYRSLQMALKMLIRQSAALLAAVTANIKA